MTTAATSKISQMTTRPGIEKTEKLLKNVPDRLPLRPSLQPAEVIAS